MIDAIGKNDQRLAALLLAHQFVGSQVNSIVKMRPSTALCGATRGHRSHHRCLPLHPPPLTHLRCYHRSIVVGLRGLKRLQSRLQFRARGSEILEQFDYLYRNE